jgi:hypothetical protein
VRFPIADLRRVGWHLFTPASYTEWCGHAQEVVPVPESASSAGTGRNATGAANVRLFRLVAEFLHAIEAGVFHPNPGGSARTAGSGASAGRGGEGCSVPAQHSASPAPSSRGEVKVMMDRNLEFM